MAYIRRFIAIASLLLLGCGEIQVETGDRISSGQRLKVRILCPGSESFPGYIDHYGRLTTEKGDILGNPRTCAYYKEG